MTTLQTSLMCHGDDVFSTPLQFSHYFSSTSPFSLSAPSQLAARLQQNGSDEYQENSQVKAFLANVPHVYLVSASRTIMFLTYAQFYADL